MVFLNFSIWKHLVGIKISPIGTKRTESTPLTLQPNFAYL